MNNLKFVGDLSAVGIKHQTTNRKAVAVKFWEHDFGEGDPWFAFPPDLGLKLAWFLLRKCPTCLISNFWRDFLWSRRK